MVQMVQQTEDLEQGAIPLQNPDRHWRAVFEKYDRDHDGRISLDELNQLVLSREYENDIPERVVKKIMLLADKDGSGYLDLQEFIEMIKSPEYQSLFGFLVRRYVHSMVPHRPEDRNRPPSDTIDGLYEEEYSCNPPAVCMIIFSLIEIFLYIYNLVDSGYYSLQGQVFATLIYNPYKRYEAWRFLTYMFVHVGLMHLFVNLLVQIMLGIPLEMVHKWWRVSIIYLAGVIAGSLGTSVTDPSVFLAGASGGVYALITAHISTIIMNWSQMEFAVYQLLVFLVLTITDLGTAIYNRYVIEKDGNIGYSAHLFGAVAGLLVGINVLRNLKVTTWERVLWWMSLITYITLMGVLIVWNVAFPDYFPSPRPNYR